MGGVELHSVLTSALMEMSGQVHVTSCAAVYDPPPGSHRTRELVGLKGAADVLGEDKKYLLVFPGFCTMCGANITTTFRNFLWVPSSLVKLFM
jgi:hypothetical protein